MKYQKERKRLQRAAAAIATRTGRPYGKLGALRKLFLSERWRGGRRAGWKRGEIFEVAEALLGHGNLKEEWGDLAYYIAQSYDWAWRLYANITPRKIVASAVAKFERRAGFDHALYVRGRRGVWFNLHTVGTFREVLDEADRVEGEVPGALDLILVEGEGAQFPHFAGERQLREEYEIVYSSILGGE